MTRSILLSVVMLFAASGCEGKLPDETRQAVASTTGTLKTSNTESQPELHKLVTSGHEDGLKWPSFSPWGSDIKTFYESSNFALAWLRNGQPSSQAMAYVAMFQRAAEKGLVAEDYDASLWDSRVEMMKTSPSAADLANFDVALTVSLMRYVRALNLGRLNPKQLSSQVDFAGKKIDLAAFLSETLESASDPAATMKAVEPPWPGYWRMLDTLHRVRDLLQQDSGELLPVPSGPVLPGQAYASVPRLAAMLRLIGDLPPSTQVDTDSGTYGGVLPEAVKAYQSRHGLSTDGTLTAGVINDLNTPLSHRVRQIELALERWRWVSHAFSQPPIVVNVPEFKLRAYDDSGHVMLSKNIIVGKAYGHGTPLFEKDIKYVVFRPYWDVPLSIQRNEIVPHIERNPTYFSKENLEVVASNGSIVTEGPVSNEVLAQLRSGRDHVRQRPGPGNSLGLVKIIFPNSYNVYLHGTDAPKLFALSRRDLSHGCMRVENPADLVAWTLRNNPGWTLDRVEASMNGKEDNVTVNLAKPIPVVILYSTVSTDENGRAYFFDDIYGFDALLDAALAKGYPYPSM